MGHRLLALLARLALLAPLAAAAAPAIELSTSGGDAWTFAKSVAGRFSDVSCERVVVRAPHAEIEAAVAQQRFFAEVPLREGPNELVAVCVRGGVELARSQPQQWRVRLEDRPRARARVAVEEDRFVLDAGASLPAPAAPAAIASREWRAREGNPAPLLTSAGAVLDEAPIDAPRLELATPAADGDYVVELRLTDALGRSGEAAAMLRVTGGRPVRVDLAAEHPQWADGAVLYGVAPFFFGEPEFRRIAGRLDEIAALGATAVWLSPVTAAPDDDFGYAVIDHFSLRESFGNERAFRALVERAHELGLRVLLDFVPNHVSERHPYFESSLAYGARSAYYDWFERDASGEPTTYFDWTHLKNLDYDNAEVQAYVIAAFTHWIDEYAVDGFRVDASWAVRERAPEFWPRWREALKQKEPDLLLLAEASARDPYYVARGFDAAYDWTSNLGEWAWLDAFDEPRVDVAALRDALTNGGRGYPPDTLTLRFLNNNDTGERFISRYGPALTRVAATMLFTVPGIALVYNGDEVGAQFLPYDEGPPIVWRDDHDLVPHYTRLARLRELYPALQSRTLALLPSARDPDVIGYVREAPGADSVLVVLNFGADAAAVQLRPDASAARGAMLADGTPPAVARAISRIAAQSGAHDLLTDRRVAVDPAELTLSLGGHTALVLRVGADAR